MLFAAASARPRRLAMVVGLATIACAAPPAESPDELDAGPDAAGHDTAGEDVAGQDASAGLDAAGSTTGDVTSGCPTGAACDDGDPCTVGDRCEGGTCVAGANACFCKADADCASNGLDLCLGTPTCDKSAMPWRCRAAPATAVSCDQSSDTWCKTTACEPATGKCVATLKPHGQPCEDGAPCSVGDTCKSGTCAAGPSICACASDNDCAAVQSSDLCLGPVGDPCTAEDQCVGGVCVGAQTKPGQIGTACGCKSDDDCAALSGSELGAVDLCDGPLYCDGADSTCKQKPGTAVACGKGDDSDCVKSACQPASGVCQPTPIDKLKKVCDGNGACSWRLLTPGENAEIAGCEDGNACTAGDTCDGGTCVGGTFTCGCATDKDCASKEDGDPCNGTLFCNKANNACEVNKATVVVCPAGADTACRKNACLPASGDCAPTPAEAVKLECDGVAGACRYSALPKAATVVACDDGDPCTVSDTCGQGECKAGPIDRGSAACACKTDADCADKFADKCAGKPFCNQQSNQCALDKSAAVACSVGADTDCAKNACDPATGTCAMSAAGQTELLCAGSGDAKTCRRALVAGPLQDVACSDGNPCSAPDTCAGQSCKPGALICSCWVDADCAPNEDGDACNGTLFCDKSGQKPACAINPASVVSCPASNKPCVAPACNPKGGACVLVPMADGATCTDNNACTTNDRCKQGGCSGPPTSCDDGDACTIDTCAAQSGCAHTALACDDGNACTADKCAAVVGPDGVKKGQCAQDAVALNGQACEADGDPCTANDTCAAGLCKSGPVVVCKAPKNTCLVANSQASGDTYTCQQTVKADGASCDDDTVCTVGNTCKSGVCTGGVGQRLFRVTRGPPSDRAGAFHAVVAWPGGLLAGGYSDKPKGGDRRTWLVGTNRVGQVTMERVGTVTGDGEAGILAMEATGTTVVTLDAPRPSGTTAARARVRRWAVTVGDKGVTAVKVASSMWLDPVGKERSVGVALALGADGRVAIAGEELGPKYPDPALWLLPAEGGKTLKVTPKAYGDQLRLRAVTVHDSGLTVVGGLVEEFFEDLAAWWAVDDKGHVRWQNRRLLEETQYDIELAAITALKARKDGTTLAAATSLTGKQHVIALDKHGIELWRGQGHVGKGAHLALATNERPLLAMTRTIVGASAIKVVGGDRRGNVLWSILHGAGASARGITSIGDRAFVAGSDVHAGKAVGVLMALDAWGNDRCQAAGDCFRESVQACDDDNPCTLPSCTFAKGCAASPVTGALCDPGDGCGLSGTCQLATCVPSVGRLHNGTIAGLQGIPKLDFIHDIAELPDGRIAVSGEHSFEAVRVLTDRFGRVLRRDLPDGDAFAEAIATIQPPFSGRVMLMRDGDTDSNYLWAKSDHAAKASSSVILCLGDTEGCEPFDMVSGVNGEIAVMHVVATKVGTALRLDRVPLLTTPLSAGVAISGFNLPDTAEVPLPAGKKKAEMHIASSSGGDYLLVGRLGEHPTPTIGWVLRVGESTTWSRAMTAEGFSEVAAGALTAQSHAIIAAEKVSAQSFFAVHAVRLDTSGKTVWSRALTGKGDHFSNGVVTDGDGAVLAGSGHNTQSAFMDTASASDASAAAGRGGGRPTDRAALPRS